MHTAGYAALGLSYTYVPFGVTDLPGAIGGMRALNIRGLGVSMPFKREVIPLLDRVDPLAAAIDAVNTIVNDEGVLTGYNTDAVGAADALAEQLDVRNKRVMIIGAGGAARAVAHGLKERGAVLHIVNRTRASADEIARGVGATSGSLQDLQDLSGFDAVINCTPVGMHDRAGSVIAQSAMGPDLVVMDIVYKPVHTELIALATQKGARAIHGARMLLHQAFRQFELYTRQRAPREAMEAALVARLKSA
jgi:shikimate dehydrogenase